MKVRAALFAASFIACTVLVSASAQMVTESTLLKPYPSDDWPMYNGNYSSQRHSLLKQINTANVNKLVTKWIYRVVNVRELELSPIVVKGVMYLAQFNRLDALDARTGNIIWQYKYPPVNPAWQRGTAVADNKVFLPRSDGHLMALDARTGAVLWDVKTESSLRAAAPMVAHGKIIVTGGSSIQAYDVNDGKHVWTWDVLPTDKDPEALKTWGTGKPQGGGVWLGGSYDPAQNLLFYGTGQPSPTGIGDVRPGDNLYTDSMVALDADTGKMKWYYQYTPHDTLDYDATEIPVLIDGDFKGKPRKMLMLANRSGIYYVLDRTTGEFLSGTPFVKLVTWMNGFDAKGRPNKVAGMDPSVKGTEVCPATAGATNWPSPAYNPQTKLFYVVTAEGCGIMFRESSPGVAEVLGLAAQGSAYIESPDHPWSASVRALDATTGKQVWDYKQYRSNHYGPGLLSTAGGLVFAGEQFGHFSALDAKNGKLLWSFNTGDVITAAASTYTVDGKQYVAIASNTNIVVFGLPDAAAASSTAPTTKAAAGAKP